MTKFFLASALALAAFSGCTKSDKAEATQSAEDKLPKLTVDEVDRGLAAKELTPVDCNGDHTRKRAGVLPGAILVSDEETFAASELPADKATKLVFYCANEG